MGEANPGSSAVPAMTELHWRSAPEVGEPRSSAQLADALDRLSSATRVLYIAAHPDDENTRLLSWFVNARKVNAAYLSLTRGGGGQNMIGTELGELLDVIRTEELLQARRIDGARQWFSMARDFGFSKRADESLEVWGHDEVLGDVVRVLRTYRPDLIITRFALEQPNHGHHTASFLLAKEAFEAAADPTRYPEQIAEGLEPWQATRLLHNVSHWREEVPEDAFAVEIGGWSPRLGLAYGEIAAHSRTQHKSQGFGAAGERGELIEKFSHVAGAPVQKGELLAGIPEGWTRYGKNARPFSAALKKARRELHLDAPEKALKSLLRAHQALNRLPNDARVRQARQDLEQLLLQTAGLFVRATTSQASAAVGESVDVSVELVLQRPAQVKLVSLELPWSTAVDEEDEGSAIPSGGSAPQGHRITRERMGSEKGRGDFGQDVGGNAKAEASSSELAEFEQRVQLKLPFNASVSLKRRVHIPPNAALSIPYWLLAPPTAGRFAWAGERRAHFEAECRGELREEGRGELQRELQGGQGAEPRVKGESRSASETGAAARVEIPNQQRASRRGLPSQVKADQVQADANPSGRPHAAPALAVLLNFEIEGVPIRAFAPLVYAHTDRVQGERVQPFVIMPPATLNPLRGTAMLVNDSPRLLAIRVRAEKDALVGTLSLELPSDWKLDPKEQPVQLAKRGDEQIFRFSVRSPGSDAQPIEAYPVFIEEPAPLRAGEEVEGSERAVPTSVTESSKAQPSRLEPGRAESSRAESPSSESSRSESASSESLRAESSRPNSPEEGAAKPESLDSKVITSDALESKSSSLTASSFRPSAPHTSRSWSYRLDLIDHEHIPPQAILRPAKIRLSPVKLKVPEIRVGYIHGPGDTVAEDLAHVGLKVESISDDALRAADFESYDAIVVGVRAYNTSTQLRAAHPQLMKWVENGGTVVVQYNTHTFWDRLDTPIGPLPMELGRLARITDQNAKVEILAPEHPALNHPHRITQADFEGWVQERGIYFAETWDENYLPLFRMADPHEEALAGSTLVTRHGKGRYVYTGLSFFRQLNAGVPGAYRLMLNLIGDQP